MSVYVTLLMSENLERHQKNIVILKNILRPTIRVIIAHCVKADSKHTL